MPLRITHFAQHCLELGSCGMPTALGSVKPDKPDKPDSTHWTQNENNCQPKRCALRRAWYRRWNAYVYMPLRITHFAQHFLEHGSCGMPTTLGSVKPDKPDKPDSTHWTQNESYCQPKRSDLQRAWYRRWNAYVYMPLRITHFAQHCLELGSCGMPTILGSVKPDKPDSTHWTQNESNCQPK